jgi:hypothetical protein
MTKQEKIKRGELILLLHEEYDKLDYVGNDTYQGRIFYTEETHIITIQDNTWLWGYNPTTNHRFLIN